MAGPDHEKVPTTDHGATEHRDDFGSDSGNEGEDHTARSAQRNIRSEDRRRYDRETLGQEDEVEALLAAGEKGGKRSRKGALRRLEQGAQESTSESSSLIDSSEDDLRRLDEVQVGQARKYDGVGVLSPR